MNLKNNLIVTYKCTYHYLPFCQMAVNKNNKAAENTNKEDAITFAAIYSMRMRIRCLSHEQKSISIC